MARIPNDFLEFFALLNAHSVKFAVVGGYAVAYHGFPRFTGDIDVIVGSDEENARSIMTALEELGFSEMGLSVQDFIQPDHVVQLGVPPMRIDILTNIDGVTFDQVWDQRVDVQIENVLVHFINRELLVRNKRASGRTKDLADLESLSSE
ncbi:MAG: nucleotidyltransferase [Spirochaetota bacterium]